MIRWNSFKLSEELTAPWWALCQVKSPAAFSCTAHTVHQKPLSFVWPQPRRPRPCLGLNSPTNVHRCLFTCTHIVVYTIALNPHGRSDGTQTDGLSFKIDCCFFLSSFLVNVIDPKLNLFFFKADLKSSLDFTKWPESLLPFSSSFYHSSTRLLSQMMCFCHMFASILLSVFTPQKRMREYNVW